MQFPDVEIQYAGGLAMSTKKALEPIMPIMSAYAKAIRNRIVNKRRLGDGSLTGMYAPVRKSVKKLRRRAAIKMNIGGKRNLEQAQKLLDMAESKESGRRKKSRRNYNRSGVMWAGLKAKAQKTAGRVTLSFYGSSKPKGKYKGKDKIRNKDKAWFAMTKGKGGGRKQRESVHIFTPTYIEFETMKDQFIQKVMSSVILNKKEKQKYIAQLKKGAKKDSYLHAELVKELRT